MNTKYLALLALVGLLIAPAAQAQIKHSEMRVEGMTVSLAFPFSMLPSPGYVVFSRANPELTATSTTFASNYSNAGCRSEMPYSLSTQYPLDLDS